MKPERLDEFRYEFEKYANQHLTDNMLVPEIEIDEEAIRAQSLAEPSRVERKKTVPFRHQRGL